MIINKLALFLSISLSGTAMAEVIYHDSITIKDVLIEKKESTEYFEKIKCGSYHCYGIKDKNLYAIGFNSQGQLGTKNRESTKTWKIVVKEGVLDVAPSQFGGCVYLENGLKYQTGRIEKINKEHIPKEIETWTETKKCLKEKSQ